MAGNGDDLAFVVEEVGADGKSRLERLGPSGVTPIPLANGGQKLFGTSGVLSRFRGMEYAALNWEPVLAKIRKSYLAGEKTLWAGKGPTGGKWAPLTPKYAARKGSTEIMIRSGALREALTSGDGPGAINEMTPQGITLGTSLHYAVFAQRGHGTARRRVLVVSTAQRKRWTTMVRKYVLSQPDPDTTP